MEKRLKTGVKGVSKVIVSFTSYPKRIETVADCAVTLLRQTLQPDAVVLWLSRMDFPQGDAELPGNLLALSDWGGLEIRWVDETYGCHDKYYWVMKEFPGDIVITADDDVLYPPTFVQQLVATHYKYRDSVISYRTHCIRKSADGYFAPYSNWVFEQLDFLDCPRFDLLPTGVGGVLYPPYWSDDDLFNLKVIQGSLKNADDLWLYIYGRMKGSSVVAVPSGPFPLFYIDDTQKDGLFRINLEQGGNDMALQLFFEEEPCLLERILDPIELEPEVPPDCSDEEGRRLPFLFVKIRRAIHRMH